MASPSPNTSKPLKSAWDIEDKDYFFTAVNEALLNSPSQWSLDTLCVQIQSLYGKALPHDMREVVVALIHETVRDTTEEPTWNTSLLEVVYKPHSVDMAALPHGAATGRERLAFEALRRFRPGAELEFIVAAMNALVYTDHYHYEDIDNKLDFTSEDEARAVLDNLQKRGLAAYDDETKQWSIAPSVTRRVHRW